MLTLSIILLALVARGASTHTHPPLRNHWSRGTVECLGYTTGGAGAACIVTHHAKPRAGSVFGPLVLPEGVVFLAGELLGYLSCGRNNPVTRFMIVIGKKTLVRTKSGGEA